MKILDECLHEVVDIDKMQHGFMSGRGTVDAVLDLRRLTENIRAKNKKLFFICWPGTGFWSGAKGSCSFCFEAEGCSRIFSRWGYVSL